MNRLFHSSPSRWLRIGRILVVILITIHILETLAFIPVKYQYISSLQPGTILGDPFFGWNIEQIQNVVNELNIHPVMIAGAKLLASLICLLCFWVIGGLIFWRKSNTWSGLLAAYILFSTAGGIAGLQFTQSQVPPEFRSIYSLGGILIWPTFFLMLYLFPNGRFVPRFSRYLVLLPYFLFIIGSVIPDRSPVNVTAMVVFLAYAIGGLFSQVYRYRAVSSPEERQQTRWVVYAVFIFSGSLILINIIQAGFLGMEVGMLRRFWFDLGYATLGTLLGAIIPLSIGISILRYRLWDIDVIILRTLVYGMLSVTLGLVFFGGVALLQQVFGRLTGVGNSPVAIVISTLAIAALFNPLRINIQKSIDRGFYRRKYNAQQTLEIFARSARNETDLDNLTAERVRVAKERIQPESVSLWLRPSLESGLAGRRRFRTDGPA